MCSIFQNTPPELLTHIARIPVSSILLKTFDVDSEVWGDVIRSKFSIGWLSQRKHFTRPEVKKVSNELAALLDFVYIDVKKQHTMRPVDVVELIKKSSQLVSIKMREFQLSNVSLF